MVASAAALLQVRLNIFQLDIQHHNLWQILIVFKGTTAYEWAFINVHNINHCWIFSFHLCYFTLPVQACISLLLTHFCACFSDLEPHIGSK